MTFESQSEKSVIEHSLRERIKELNGLYGIADIIERSGNSVEKILQGAVNLLPHSWQYPEIACARIVYKSKSFVTILFEESDWLQKSLILEGGGTVGSIEVYYVKEMPELHEGPFLFEERKMLDAITKSIGKALERINLIKALEKKLRLASEENTVLEDNLKKLRKTQSELIDSTQANVNILLTPLLQRLKAGNDDHKELVLLLEKSLKNLLSPFLFMISSEFPSLTKTELQIIKMIKEGRSTRQISLIRGVATSTVHRQREKIRKKIGLTNKKINLTTYIRLVMDEKS